MEKTESSLHVRQDERGYERLLTCEDLLDVACVDWVTVDWEWNVMGWDVA
jgi:hypothetical protein